VAGAVCDILFLGEVVLDLATDGLMLVRNLALIDTMEIMFSEKNPRTRKGMETRSGKDNRAGRAWKVNKHPDPTR
jgi:hypothetical protein